MLQKRRKKAETMGGSFVYILFPVIGHVPEHRVGAYTTQLKGPLELDTALTQDLLLHTDLTCLRTIFTDPKPSSQI